MRLPWFCYTSHLPLFNPFTTFAFKWLYMDQAISKNNVPVRLSSERWLHITTGHPEVAGLYYEILETIENPLCIYEGNYNELIAVGKFGNIPGKFVVVVYKEINLNDGFVITAYVSNKMQTFTKKKIIWKQQ